MRIESGWFYPLFLGVTVWLLGSPVHADGDPFEIQTVQVQGRPTQAFGVAEGPQERLVVLSVEGGAPNEVRRLSLLPAPPRGGETRPTLPEKLGGFVIPGDVVAIDVGDLDPAPGLEALLITGPELRIVSAADGTQLKARAMKPALPLPPRTRGLSRLRAVREWEGPGKLGALIPTWNGLRLVPLDGAASRLLKLEVLSDYETFEPTNPAYNGLMKTEYVWPMVDQADDNGDGIPDLFAATRYEVSVFQVGAEGLPSEPSRKVRFRRFSPEDERRYRSHTLRSYFRDVDGDGHSEIIEHRSTGSISESHTSTRFYGGPGANPSGEPMAELIDDRGFAGIGLFDLDHDGRFEILQNVVPFGILQIARVLTTRRVEAELRVFTWPDGPDPEPKETWQAGLRVPLDFAGQRIQGLLPTPAGDWNGDGLQDLIHSDGLEAVVLRLGEVNEDGPGFGDRTVRQEIPSSDIGVVADLNGDGLDDFITYDSLDQTGQIRVGINRGVLPGTPPRIGPTR